MRGLTLLEALISLGLLALAVVMIGGAAEHYTRLFGRHDQQAQAAVRRQAVTRVAEELTEATEIYAPAAGENTSEVEFSKIDPAASRLPSPPAGPPPPLPAGSPLFNPTAADHTLRIRIYLDDHQLIRQVTFPGGASRFSVLAHELYGFTAERLSRDEVSLRASFMEHDELRHAAARTCWWTTP